MSGLLLCALVIGACAHELKPASADENRLESAVTETEQPDRSDNAADATDSDVMYRVLSGETLGADGDLEGAANEYLEAAMESDDPAIAARAARVAVAAQAWQKAAMAADRWVLLEPENIDARQTAVSSMIIVGDYLGAEYHLSGILSQMAHDPARAWMLVAELLTAAGNAQKADQIMARLIEDKQAQRNPDALFARSLLSGRRGDLQTAVRLARDALEIDTSRADIHAWSGRLAMNLQQSDEALVHYKSAWELKPEDMGIVMAYAELLRRTGEIEQAQSVLESLPDSPATRFTRIVFARNSELQELALELYQGYEGANYPDETEKAFQAGQAAEVLNLPKEAIEWYAKITEGERKLVAVLRQARLTAQIGDLEGARSQLVRLRLNHDAAIKRESYMAESEILVNANQPQEAFRVLGEALAGIDSDPGLLYSRALVAAQINRVDVAEADLRKILDSDPDNAAALNALGYTLADQTDRYAEAERYIRAAFELQPDDVSIIDSMGWVAYKLGRINEAEHFLRDAWERDHNAEIGAHFGEVLWLNQKYEEAREVWRVALESEPDNETLLSTLRRLSVAP